MEKYKNDPTDEFETVKELTYEDEFYSHDVELPEFALVYINQLELEIKRLKSKPTTMTNELLFNLTKPK